MMSMAAAATAQRETQSVLSQWFSRRKEECERERQQFEEAEEGRDAPHFCGIAPWAYTSALRVQSLGIQGQRRREALTADQDPFRPGAGGPRDERGNQATIFDDRGRREAQSPLDILAQLCLRPRGR